MSDNKFAAPCASIFDPIATGTISPSITSVRIAERISSIENSSPAKYLSIKSSLVSATASISESLKSCKFGKQYSGISHSSLCPIPVYLLPAFLMTLIYPTSFSFSRIGWKCGAIFFPYLAVKSSTTCRKLASSTSISVTYTILGRLYLSHNSHAFSVPTSTPAFPETTITAASAALTASSTSPTKSKYPGVSKILIFAFSHSIGIRLVLIENSRFCSSLSKSLIVLWSVILPIRLVAPDT